MNLMFDEQCIYSDLKHLGPYCVFIFTVNATEVSGTCEHRCGKRIRGIESHPVCTAIIELIMLRPWSASCSLKKI